MGAEDWATLGPPWAHPMAGRVEERVIDSQALTGNLLGDPHRRPVLVQLPPAYEAEPDRRFPAIYVLQGLSNAVDTWRNRRAWQRNPVEELDAAWVAGAAPAVIVYVDAWTRLGGSQFVDSPGTGRYGTYLWEDVVPFVDGAYRTLAAAEHRGLAGHSSGGYGAMVNAMLRPDLFGGFASHAGDGLFELCYLPEVGAAVKALRDQYGGSLDAFWQDFYGRPGRGRAGDGALLNLGCMAACWSADADGTVRLPFDTETGELIPEVWDRWLAADPVRMAPSHAEALRAMRAIWLDAGRGDEYSLDLATTAFHRQVLAAGVDGDRIHFELFEGGHGNVAWRYPLALT
ncbi:MAG TPA: alpha/beta hydrolase-fold protein, partial [Candidatus Limnocylindria bacterium]|nr:alpha/beta hydrolase-fold protein [Candidatus Limnocylindria bacterium]